VPRGYGKLAGVSSPPAGLDEAANVADLVRTHRATRPDSTAIVDDANGVCLSWAELDAAVERLARGLSVAGLVAGQRVAFALGNSPAFVVTYLAVARAGLVSVPMNPRSATGEIARMLADSGARMVVADSSTVSSVRAAVDGLADALQAADDQRRARTPVPLVVVDGVPVLPGERRFADLSLSGGGAGTVLSPVDPENLALLLYTSGTSGQPRGVMLSSRALLANISQVASIAPAPTRGDDVVLGVLPLFHVYGLNAVLGQVLACGATLVLAEQFDVEATLQLIVERSVTNVPVAPPVIAAWAGRAGAAEALAGVRVLLSGAAPLDPELAALMTRTSGVPVEQGYGLTEAAPVVTSTLTSGARAAGRNPDPAGVGGPLPGVELEVRDATGASTDEPGQIWVRGSNLFSGYWPDGADGPTADGWWGTGDIGLLDAVGDLILVDRLRELVLVSGFNVYPSEIEAVIAEVPGVAEVAVIGVPDARTGEAAVAYLVADGADRSDDSIEERVLTHCRTRLARYKQPREVSVVQGLPHSATGKVAKGRLRAQARRALLGLQ
jgi:long-chain acyl-CoA synthetase